MLTHNEAQKAVVSWIYKQRKYSNIIMELKYQNSIIDVYGLGKDHNRAIVVEVKVQRGDLLQDIQRGKLFKYEKYSSLCYIAATRDALTTQSIQTDEQIIADLTSKGLKNYWGIAEIQEDLTVRVIRKPRTHRNLAPNQHKAISKKIMSKLNWYWYANEGFGFVDEVNKKRENKRLYNKKNN